MVPLAPSRSLIRSRAPLRIGSCVKSIRLSGALWAVAVATSGDGQDEATGPLGGARRFVGRNGRVDCILVSYSQTFRHCWCFEASAPRILGRTNAPPQSEANEPEARCAQRPVDDAEGSATKGKIYVDGEGRGIEGLLENLHWISGRTLCEILRPRVLKALAPFKVKEAIDVGRLLLPHSRAPLTHCSIS